MFKLRRRPGAGSEADRQASASRRTPLWQAFVLPVAAILSFFLLLEGSLALFGVRPAVETADPFVGFASHSPLFVPSPGADGEQVMVTAPNKKDFFNRQSFPLKKDPRAFRIFTLGGSTTYGRPYDDSTSFSGWLRELLPAVDRDKHWEVINAGGISYASYRLVKLMEELIQYQPDLFIIYTGHNEFLEERTYRKVRETHPALRETASLLAKTRTWSAMSRVLERFAPSPGSEGPYQLSAEVDAILDRSVGLDAYTRDDALRGNVLKHFQLSLEHMVTLARSVGAQVVFVVPASNLKDCTPFKSEDTPGISKAASQQSWKFLSMTKPLVWQQQWELILRFLDQALAVNPRYADLHFRRGQALFALGRLEEAKKAFITARDEDICPLRAVSPIAKIVADVANANRTLLVDYPGLLEQRMRSTYRHSILGEEFFLDHVHPTIEGHKLLGAELIEVMAGPGLVHPRHDWRNTVLPEVAKRIEGGVDPLKQGRALANLARVLLWAQKNDEAARLARQAMEVAGDIQEVADNAAASLATAYVRNGQPHVAVNLLYQYLARYPNSIELRLRLGQVLLDPRLNRREEAAANLLLIAQQMPYYDWGHALFGIDMAQRGRPRIAYPSLMEAVRLNPNNADAREELARVRSSLAGQELDPTPALIRVDRYPSSAPRRVLQGRINESGDFVPDGIEAEFHENGRVKRFVDIDRGKPSGPEMTWGADGTLLSQLAKP